MTAQQLKNAILQEMFLPREDWDEKELKDIVSKQCPISYGIVQQGNHVDGGVPVVRPVDLHCKYVGRNFLKCTSSDISESYSRTVLRGDEILLCVRGTTGIVALAKEELKGCNVNRGIVPLFFDNNIDRLFVYYQLQTPKVQEIIASNTMGSALRQINIKDLRKIVLSYPPLSEQKYIVAKIEELLPKVEKYGKAQDELNKLNKEPPERLKKSILQEAIEGRLVPQDPNDEPASVLLEKIREEKKQLVKAGKLKKKDLEEKPISEDEIPFEIPESWEWVRLENISTYISRGKSPVYSEIQKYPIVAQKCNQWSGFSLEKAKFADPKTIDKYAEERLLRDGDLLWNSTGLGTLGRMAIYNSSINQYGWAAADSHVTVIRTLPEFSYYKYLYYYFASNEVQSVIEDKSDGSTKQKELSQETVRKYLVPLPPLAEQHRIVAKVEELLQKIDGLKK